MGRPLESYDDIAIAELAFYTIALAGGVFLCIKHGFTKNAGWRALIILALARMIGASLRLATINSPDNINLYIGWMTLNGIGLAPLLMLVIGLLTRIFDALAIKGKTIIEPRYQRFIELILLLAIILLIVGGTQSKFTVIDGKPKVDYSTVSHAAAGILVAITGLLGVGIVIAFIHQGYLSQGEHRVVFCIVACFPLIVIRLTYSCLLIFGNITSTPWLYLGLSSLMEMIVTLIMEATGFTLHKTSPPSAPRDEEEMRSFRK